MKISQITPVNLPYAPREGFDLPSLVVTFHSQDGRSSHTERPRHKTMAMRANALIHSSEQRSSSPQLDRQSFFLLAFSQACSNAGFGQVTEFAAFCKEWNGRSCLHRLAAPFSLCIAIRLQNLAMINILNRQSDTMQWRRAR